MVRAPADSLHGDPFAARHRARPRTRRQIDLAPLCAHGRPRRRGIVDRRLFARGRLRRHARMPARASGSRFARPVRRPSHPGTGDRRAPPARGALDAVNSGTTLRLMSGILAGHDFKTVISGDESLQRRPMRRIIDPLTRMGARIESVNDRAPLTIRRRLAARYYTRTGGPERAGEERCPARWPARNRDDPRD